jgi:hypothetical protein
MERVRIMIRGGRTAGRWPFLTASLLFAAWLGCGGEPRLCEVCRRSLHADVQATLVLADGDRVHACCPRCALHYMERNADRVARMEVTDHGGGGSIAIADAYLVEGSDRTPCLEHHVVADETGVPLRICYDRCMPSLIAFRSEENARAFIAEHGGTLLPAGARAAPPAH